MITNGPKARVLRIFQKYSGEVADVVGVTSPYRYRGKGR